MERKYRYIGLFVSFDSLHEKMNKINGVRLHKLIENPHVTFCYMPDKVDTEIFGKRVEIRAVGYGNDGKNEGLKVEIVSNDPVINEMMSEITVPHITVSVSRSGRPVDTKHLNFELIEPFVLEGVFGGYDDNDMVVTDKDCC